MTKPGKAYAMVVEAELPGDAPEEFRAALFCWGFALAILFAGSLALGVPGMFDIRSPDFFPLPDFFAVAAFLVGSFFLVRAAISYSRFSRFGTSTLEASAASLGHLFEGRVRTSKDVVATGPFTLRLRCDRRSYGVAVDRPSRGSQGSEHMWEDVTTLPAAASTREGLPFSIALPLNGLPTGNLPKPKGVHPGPPDQIEWILQVSAPTAGIDYVEEFPIRVTVSPESRAAARAESAKATTTQASAPIEPDLLVDEESPTTQRALGLLALASIFFDGYVPDKAERQAERRLAQRPDLIEVSAKPFEGYVKPEQDGVRLFRRVFLGFGLLVLISAAYALSQQALYGHAGERLQGTIAAVDGKALSIILTDGQPARVGRISNFHHWKTGALVTLICRPIRSGDEQRHCQVETGLDRWLDPLALLAIASGMLGVGWWLRRRPPST